MSEKKLVHCYHCGNEWETESQKIWVTCTNCMRKINTERSGVLSPTLVHFNIDEHGIKLLDRTLATRASPNGLIIDIHFKPNKAHCEYCDSDNCKHVVYAVSLPIVQKILRKKGWKLT